MIPVLSRAQMRAFDQHAIQVCKVAGVLLMENAGRGAAEAIVRRMTDKASWRAVVVAGPGNNGGDGFVVARHLLARGALVQVQVFERKHDGGLSSKPRTENSKSNGTETGQLAATLEALLNN